MLLYMMKRCQVQSKDHRSYRENTFSCCPQYKFAGKSNMTFSSKIDRLDGIVNR